jgi:SAM-dependent methyltransferase
MPRHPPSAIRHPPSAIRHPPMFKDHFSRQAESYQRYRPGYPAELYAWLADIVSSRAVALDCATGNGQAALGLAHWFEHVIAIDGSVRQLALATREPRVSYLVNLAERLALRSASVDLVVAAQAAHWFEQAPFHAEVDRVLMPGGVLAIWTYEKFRAGPAIDATIDRFYDEVIGPYWPPERRHVEQAYRTLPFPYPEIASPVFELVNRWDLATVSGYLESWSAVQRFRDARGENPLPALLRELEPHWTRAGGIVELRWPIHLRIGRKPDAPHLASRPASL